MRSAVAARTAEALIDAMGVGLRQVSLRDILGWFGSCGLEPSHGSRSPNEEPLVSRGFQSRGLCAIHG
jgi:hypothetical protein